ncbi:unnamed protein product [Albugo candida]|uniref:Uncharacterized protein n=1 Tax=Albugo candida TaxID=65357 RepID=A0A024FUF5_9STRA|nr:unnamed protein product [Albugo candida]|eukprot:CCI10294.1 unnamed protein product [Albugo candida]
MPDTDPSLATTPSPRHGLQPESVPTHSAKPDQPDTDPSLATTPSPRHGLRPESVPTHSAKPDQPDTDPSLATTPSPRHGLRPDFLLDQLSLPVPRGVHTGPSHSTTPITTHVVGTDTMAPSSHPVPNGLGTELKQFPSSVFEGLNPGFFSTPFTTKGFRIKLLHQTGLDVAKQPEQDHAVGHLLLHVIEQLEGYNTLSYPYNVFVHNLMDLHR